MNIYRIYIVLMLLAVIFQTVLADPIFDSPVDYSVGTYPISICGADFDGDLDNDLAVANNGSSSVSVLINNGNGTFQSPVDYPVVGSPVDIVAADFTGDLQVDLAITCTSPSAVLILAGNGDGIFQDTVINIGDTPAEPRALCAGDFDNDSENDLAVVGGWNQTSFGCAYINGFDFYENHFTYEGASPYDVVTADFDGDNDDDLAVLDYISRYIYIYRSAGLYGWFGTWAFRYYDSGFDQMFCADVNGDTIMDIIGAVGGDNGGYEIFPGHGNCTFGPGSCTDSIGPMTNLYVTDFDADGDLDIALTGESLDSVFIALNDNSGSFSTPSAFYSGGGSSFIFAIELNGDNYNDLVVAHIASNTVSVLINGSGTDLEDDYLASLPGTYWLSNNYPNPFNSLTLIKYYLQQQSQVNIDIFDILGRKIQTLAEGIQPSGNYQARWDASSQSSGIYIYKLQAGDYTETKKMLLLK